MTDAKKWQLLECCHKEEVRIFSLLERASTALAALERLNHFPVRSRINELLCCSWTIKLEFSFDNAGPVLGTIIAFSASSPAVEIIRMEPLIVGDTSNIKASWSHHLLFDSVLTARDLARLAVWRGESLESRIDTMLNEGALCTLDYLVGGEGALECRLILRDSSRDLIAGVRVETRNLMSGFPF